MLHLVDLLARDFERVHQGGGGDDRGAVLVVVEDGDVAIRWFSRATGHVLLSHAAHRLSRAQVGADHVDLERTPEHLDIDIRNRGPAAVPSRVVYERAHRTESHFRLIGQPCHRALISNIRLDDQSLTALLLDGAEHGPRAGLVRVQPTTPPS